MTSRNFLPRPHCQATLAALAASSRARSLYLRGARRRYVFAIPTGRSTSSLIRLRTADGTVNLAKGTSKRATQWHASRCRVASPPGEPRATRRLHDVPRHRNSGDGFLVRTPPYPDFRGRVSSLRQVRAVTRALAQPIACKRVHMCACVCIHTSGFFKCVHARIHIYTHKTPEIISPFLLY